ncbi:hypothetical protein SAY87_012074 [Trapa incisa]|uniref:C2 NT-type domain-containing protein n=1 Tax=Trapa incisa TaxID=236973 RepID=A0AAN7JJ88_9MYRT|nr:hypothetical protein SAY87_012074 [Trapa incisa]
MALEYSSGKRNSSSNTQLLQELEALSQTLYQSHTASTNRRTSSLVLPRTSAPAIPGPDDAVPSGRNEERSSSRPRSRRMSLSPWRSRPKVEEPPPVQQVQTPNRTAANKMEEKLASSGSGVKKGIWNWKPIRALSHIGMQKISCLFSVEVVAAQGLPASMNGLRLSACVRKKETKDGAVHTMPSRVSQGAADFEETLFVKCHVYGSPGGGRQLKFEPRPFLIYLFAVDADELDFGRTTVDLSRLIHESMEKSLEGTRVRQWDTSFNLLGKAKGGELVLKLGFQIMEKDGGSGIYSQMAEGLKADKSKILSSSFGRKQSKTSFSIPSPRMQSKPEAWTPSQGRGMVADIHGMDDLNLDEPAPMITPTYSTVHKAEEPESKIEDLDIPDFEVVDRGIEGVESDTTTEGRSASSEVVKEVVHDQIHLTRLTELDSIAQQIKALESMIGEEEVTRTKEAESQRLDADEETVTREFLQMLENEESDMYKFDQLEIPPLHLEGVEHSNDSSMEADSKGYLSDLGKGLGCVVQTRNGGYLAATNPLDTEVLRKDTPKLAMQVAKPVVLSSTNSSNGFELFQRMAAVGTDELSSQFFSLMPIDELMDKTAEQIAFEGIASAIIQGRNKEGANSTAARTVATVKTIANAMTAGRKERISAGIWNVSEEPITAEEILGHSMQRIETMAVEALKIQAEIGDEEAPFDVSPLLTKDEGHPLSSAAPLEDWVKGNAAAPAIRIAVLVQLRDPLRRYEAVGGPIVALIHAERAETKLKPTDEESKYKITSLHIGGIMVRTGGKRSAWDSEKQRLTAMQWLVAYGLGKSGKRIKPAVKVKGQDLLWSISSRVMADMWLKSMRNPNVKLTK